MQDPAYGRRYERVLGALLCLCGVKLRAELEKQTHLVTLLGAVAERVRQAGGSTRQVSVCVLVCGCDPTVILFYIMCICVCIKTSLCFLPVCSGGAAGGPRKRPKLFPEEQLPAAPRPQSGGQGTKR